MTRLMAFTLLAWLGLALAVAEAGSQSPMYDAATLNRWEPIFREDVLYNFRKLVLPKLWETASYEEKSRLRRVKVSFPHYTRDNSGPLDFYASDDTISMPVESLRFLGDITLATAWLWSKGYSTSTVFQYLGMLKYQSGTRIAGVPNPRPLETLGIPENARDDPRTRERLSTMFSTAVMFILCHELAHVYYRHPGYDRISAEQAHRNEAPADALAVELMWRIGDPPCGAALFFKAGRESARTAFDGAYVGTITSSANPDGVDMKLVLNRSGDQVAGEYSYAAAYGTLKGYVTGGELRFRWEEAGYFGKGKLRQRSERAGSTLAGTWGDEGAEVGGGRMILRRP